MLTRINTRFWLAVSFVIAVDILYPSVFINQTPPPSLNLFLPQNHQAQPYGELIESPI